MSRQSADICALCKHFKMKEHPEHARVGLGRCVGRKESTAPLINPFVPWAKKACERYAKPANTKERLAWIEKRQAKEQSQATPAAVPTQQGEYDE
jgi:hypothetical protein